MHLCEEICRRFMPLFLLWGETMSTSLEKTTAPGNCARGIHSASFTVILEIFRLKKRKRSGIKGAAGFSSGYFLWKCGNVQQNMYIIYTWVLGNLLDFWLLLKSKIIIFYTWKILCSHHVSSKKTKIGWRISAATSKVFCHKIILQLLPIH